MRRPVSLFALVALAPFAIGVGTAHASGDIASAICSGGPTARTITLPIPRKPRGNGDDPHCNKACHAGGSRKRVLGEFDPSQ